MKTKVSILLSVSALAMVACSGGKGGDSPAPAVSAAAPTSVDINGPAYTVEENNLTQYELYNLNSCQRATNRDAELTVGQNFSTTEIQIAPEGTFTTAYTETIQTVSNSSFITGKNYSAMSILPPGVSVQQMFTKTPNQVIKYRFTSDFINVNSVSIQEDNTSPAGSYALHAQGQRAVTRCQIDNPQVTSNQIQRVRIQQNGLSLLGYRSIQQLSGHVSCAVVDQVSGNTISYVDKGQGSASAVVIYSPDVVAKGTASCYGTQIYESYLVKDSAGNQVSNSVTANVFPPRAQRH